MLYDANTLQLGFLADCLQLKQLLIQTVTDVLTCPLKEFSLLPLMTPRRCAPASGAAGLHYLQEANHSAEGRTKPFCAFVRGDRGLRDVFFLNTKFRPSSYLFCHFVHKGVTLIS